MKAIKRMILGSIFLLMLFLIVAHSYFIIRLGTALGVLAIVGVTVYVLIRD